MKARFLLVLAFALSGGLVAAQEPPADLVSALRAFQAGDYQSALSDLNQGIERDDAAPWLGHYRFWQGRTLMAANLLGDAADAFDLFLSRFPTHPYREEATYQRARLFYLTGEYEAAIDQFSLFAETYPDSSFYPNALYWTGESLFATGNINEAERLFAEVTERYPTSYRVEAARYRLDIIELSRRENELLTLLQWSHEEYLAALENFQQREQTYREALTSYRNRLASLATDDFEDEILALNDQIDSLESELLEKDVTIFELMSRIRQLEAGSGSPEVSTQTPADTSRTTTPTTETAATVDPDATDLELRETLLDLKAQALELQRSLRDEMEAGQ
jgi:TolA-binding protein